MVEADHDRWSGRWWLHVMSSNVGNALPLFIRKWVGLLFTSDLLHNLDQIKVK